MKRIIKYFVCFLLCFSVVVLFNQKQSSANSNVKLDIVTYNVSYADQIYLLVAGTSSNVEEVSDIKMLFWNELQEEYTVDNADYESVSKGSQNIKGFECQIYYSDGISAKELNDNIYFCSYVKIDGVEYYSEVHKYSVVNYVYDRMQSTVSDNQKEVYTSLLNYGAATQVLFNYNTEHLANETYYKVTVTNGKLEDGFTYGLYEKNQKAILTANSSEYEFLHWVNSTNEVVSYESVFELEVLCAESYTAVFKENEIVSLKQPLLLDVAYDVTKDTLDLPTTVDVFDSKGNTLSLAVNWDIDGFIENKIGNQVINGQLVDSTYQLDSALQITLNVLPYTLELNAETNKYSLVKYYGSEEVVEVPSVYRESSIVTIKNACFDSVNSMTKLVIPSTIETIENGAIVSCAALTSIEVPFTGESRETNQFFGYIFGAETYNSQNDSIPTSLSEVIISSGLTTLPAYAFYGCKNIVDLTLPETIETSEKGIFSSAKLTNLYYNGTIERWCNISFADIYSSPMHVATSFYLKNSNGVYSELTSVVIPGSVSEVGSYQFRGFTNLKTVEISEGITYIGNQSFQNCTNLTTITLPKSLTTIGENIGNNVFSNCKNISKVYYNGTIEDWCKITLNGNNNTPMNVGVYFYYKNSSGNYVELTSLEIPSSIASIGKYQFYGFNRLTSVVIGSQVETIGLSAFDSCTSLSTVTIKEGVKTISKSAFSGCAAIKNITLPNSLETLGERVFYNCSGLTSIVIPYKITTIKQYTFYKCTKLISMVIPVSVVTIETYATALSSNIANIYYCGTEEMWASVSISSSGNPSFQTATITYNYVLE